MVKKEPTNEEKEALKKLQKEIKDPNLETRNVPLVKNTYKIKGKKVSQYKINIPKKFADVLEFDKRDIKIEATLDKGNNKIIFEVSENS